MSSNEFMISTMGKAVSSAVSAQNKLKDSVAETLDATYNFGYEVGTSEVEERIIRQAQETYPADIFPEPDWEQVREALSGIGVTLDAVAGSLLRRQIPMLIKERETNEK